MSLVVFAKSQATGTNCIIEKTGHSGICKPFEQCSSAIEAMMIDLTDLPSICDRQSCTVEKTNMTGKCLPLEKCKSALEAFQIDQTDLPTVCDHNLQTVCCPNISELKCLEYGEFYINISFSSPMMIGAKKTKIRTSNCIKSDALVINGDPAKYKEFPHMALLGNNSFYFCGGSLISDQWILTAAHCLPLNEVKLGSLNRQDSEDGTDSKYRVIENVLHPGYVKGKVLNDIGLLKLDRVVVFKKNIVPACLPQTRNWADSFATATGWGAQSEDIGQSEKLMKVRLEIFPRDECNRHFSRVKNLPDGIDNEMMICAGHRTKPKDTCTGDSGGPLQIYRNDMRCMFTIIGATSFGHRRCGKIGVPAVYARIYNYLDWIENTFSNLNLLTNRQIHFSLISECIEYGKYYTKIVEILSIDNKRLNKTFSTCNPCIPLIHNGSNATEKEFPHMAMVGFGTEKSLNYGCWGSLISEQWVLTAGHCSETRSGPTTCVKLGSLQRTDNSETDFKYSVIQVVTHPEYVRGKTQNDIALLKLDQVTNAIYIISLPDGIIDDMMICAGHRTEAKDSCRGDSGGPLQVYRHEMPCMFELVGSTSFGHRMCITTGVPAVYARTYNFLDWIENTVWPESFNKTE
ncbi:unnamed protein product [Diamesa serratosioi]